MAGSAAMPPELAIAAPISSSALPAWRGPLARLALAWAALIALAWADWAEMARQWWDASTYNHILLVPPILVWLVAQRRGELAKLTPRPWGPGVALVVAAVAGWLVGRMLGINTLSQLGAVVMLQASL